MNLSLYAACPTGDVAVVNPTLTVDADGDSVPDGWTYTPAPESPYIGVSSDRGVYFASLGTENDVISQAIGTMSTGLPPSCRYQIQYTLQIYGGPPNDFVPKIGDVVIHDAQGKSLEQLDSSDSRKLTYTGIFTAAPSFLLSFGGRNTPNDSFLRDVQITGLGGI